MRRALPMPRDLPLLAALLACVACNGSASEETADTAWGDATAVEELAIGVEFGAEEYMFGRVSDIAVSTDGTIYVADVNPIVVRAYDDEGTHLRDVGREGQGPGEFQRPAALQVLQDGRLVTWDYASSRASFFDPGGDFLGSFQASASFGGSRSFRVGREGLFYLRDFNRQTGIEADIVLAKYSQDGESLGVIELPTVDQSGRGFGLSAEGISAPSQVATFSAWSPLGYVVTGRNDRYEIELRKEEGAVTLRRDLEPVPLQPEERQEWEAFRQTVIQMGRERGTDPQYDPDPIPGVKPYFRDLFVGDDGRVWVFRCVAAQKRDDVEPLPDRPERPLLTWREPWTYDVFEPDGTFLGSVRVPELFEPFVFRGDRIWGSLVDVDGVERVVRLRVEPGGS